MQDKKTAEEVITYEAIDAYVKKKGADKKYMREANMTPDKYKQYMAELDAKEKPGSFLPKDPVYHFQPLKPDDLKKAMESRVKGKEKLVADYIAAKREEYRVIKKHIPGYDPLNPKIREEFDAMIDKLDANAKKEVEEAKTKTEKPYNALVNSFAFKTLEDRKVAGMIELAANEAAANAVINEKAKPPVQKPAVDEKSVRGELDQLGSMLAQFNSTEADSFGFSASIPSKKSASRLLI